MSTRAESTLLAKIREWANHSGAVVYTLRGKHGIFAIFPEDVIGRTDEQLINFIVMRCRASDKEPA